MKRVFKSTSEVSQLRATTKDQLNPSRQKLSMLSFVPVVKRVVQLKLVDLNTKYI